MTLTAINGFKAKIIPHHIGPSVWASDGRMYAIRYPNALMIADDGRPESLREHSSLPEARDCRCVFLAADGALFVSLFRLADGGSALLRSIDGGRTFHKVLEWLIWGMDQAADGTIYAGSYHPPNSGCGCRLFKSIDGGTTWIDIMPPEWVGQTHIHGLAINPATGWLYVNLGDVDGFDGCWRLKPNAVPLAEDAPAGTQCLRLAARHRFGVGQRVLVHDTGTTWRERIAEVADDSISIHGTLRATFRVADGARVVADRWVHKFRDPDGTLQFIHIVARGDRIFLADDNHRLKNPGNVAVWMGKDDGSDHPVLPSPVLAAPELTAWGAYFLREGRDGRMWTAFVPRLGPSLVWTSLDGEDWQPVAHSDMDGREQWKKTHSLRDAPFGAVGDGRNLSAPDGSMVVPVGFKAAHLAPPPSERPDPGAERRGDRMEVGLPPSVGGMNPPRPRFGQMIEAVGAEAAPYVSALLQVATPEATELLNIHNGYHRRASIESPEKWYWQEGLRVLQETIRDDEKVLDVGCGFAGFSYGARMAGIRNVYATDINHIALKCAEAALRRCGLEPNILYEDLGDISLRFRAVCAFDFLYGLRREAIIQIIAQMDGLLDPGGTLIFTMATPEATLLANPRATRLTEEDIVGICERLGLSLYRIGRRPRRIPFFAFQKPE